MHEEHLLECPKCGRLTDSLKQYKYMSWALFLLAAAVWQPAVHRACPPCMRQFVLGRLLINVVPANVLWLLLLLPWGVGLLIATTTKGHSDAVLGGPGPAYYGGVNVARDEGDLSWGRILAVLAILTGWMPAFGLVVAVGAWLGTRGKGGWPEPTAKVGLAISLLAHLAMGTLFAVALWLTSIPR